MYSLIHKRSPLLEYINLSYALFQIPGHLLSLQDLLSIVLPVHALPLFFACISTLLSLHWIPPLHLTVHGLQSPNVPHLQSTEIFMNFCFKNILQLDSTLLMHYNVYCSKILLTHAYFQHWFLEFGILPKLPTPPTRCSRKL